MTVIETQFYSKAVGTLGRLEGIDEQLHVFNRLKYLELKDKFTKEDNKLALEELERIMKYK